MKALPGELELDALLAVLVDGWGIEIGSAEYAAVGAGSYHWVVTGPNGMRGFVTVDDLDHKAWLVDTRESVFDGLRRAFDTAFALGESNLDFVVAPKQASHGDTVRRLGSHHTVALFPFVEGDAALYVETTPNVPPRSRCSLSFMAPHPSLPPSRARLVSKYPVAGTLRRHSAS